jgi:hypothetical protein
MILAIFACTSAILLLGVAVRLYASERRHRYAPFDEVSMSSLCYTDKTLYGIDDRGRVWFVALDTGKWELYGNPNEKDAVVKP